VRGHEHEAVRTVAAAILAHVAAAPPRGIGVCRRELTAALGLEPAVVEAVCDRLERVELLTAVSPWAGRRYRLTAGAGPGLAVHVFGGRR
jgi:hypothetical protein